MKFSKFVKSLAPDGGAIYEYTEQLNFYTVKEA